MSIKCGVCGNTHPSVAAVKACGTAPASPAPSPQEGVLGRLRRQASQPAPSNARTATIQDEAPEVMPAWVSDGPTPGAVKYALDRLEKRNWANRLDWELTDIAMDMLDGKPVSKDQCSKLIDELGKLPYKENTGSWTPPSRREPTPPVVQDHICPCGCGLTVYGNAGTAEIDATPTMPTTPTPVRDNGLATRIRRLKALVPDSRYAVELPNEDKLRFFLVSTGKNGYVKVQEYASDTLYPRRWSEYENILQTILEDGTRNAEVRFGQELGQCYHCNRALTDETSRALGIGPICRSK